MDQHSPTARIHYSLHAIAVCAIVAVVAASLLIIERLQERLAITEQRAQMIQERVSAMKAIMEIQGRELNKAQERNAPKAQDIAKVPGGFRHREPIRGR